MEPVLVQTEKQEWAETRGYRVELLKRGLARTEWPVDRREPGTTVRKVRVNAGGENWPGAQLLFTIT